MLPRSATFQVITIIICKSLGYEGSNLKSNFVWSCCSNFSKYLAEMLQLQSTPKRCVWIMAFQHQKYFARWSRCCEIYSVLFLTYKSSKARGGLLNVRMWIILKCNSSGALAGTYYVCLQYCSQVFCMGLFTLEVVPRWCILLPSGCIQVVKGSFFNNCYHWKWGFFSASNLIHHQENDDNK